MTNSAPICVIRYSLNHSLAVKEKDLLQAWQKAQLDSVITNSVFSPNRKAL